MGHEGQLIELGAIVLGLGVLARLASRFALSPIPLYLLAGLAFGEGGLVPLFTTQEFISIGAEIGVILLLLLLGLEYTADELVANLRRSAMAGFVDAALNFVPGFVIGLLLGWDLLAAFVLGGITYISSSGVIAKSLGDLGRLGNRETPVVLSILVMEDLAMAGYLPIVTGLVVGGGLAAAAGPVALALFGVAVIVVLAVKIGPRLSYVLRDSNDEVLLLLVLGLAFLVSGLASKLHISAGVGAFLVGIAVSGPVAHGARQLLTPLRDLFAAVFFVFFGLQTDPAQIPDVLGMAILLAVITTVTKILTGWWAAGRAGIGRNGRMRAGLALVARGEFSVVIAGLAVGVETDLAPLAATYVLILAIIGPLLTRIERLPARRTLV